VGGDRRAHPRAVGLDLPWSGRRPHAVGFGEAVIQSVAYIGVAVAFGVGFGFVAGWDLGAEYFAGYVVEKSLFVDNLFVFVVFMTTFAVPAEYQQKVLTIGILIALVLRAIFGITREAYIVFAANAFALLGLRAPFFLVSGLLDRPLADPRGHHGREPHQDPPRSQRARARRLAARPPGGGEA
jgi:Integral membrane protein TerC family